MTKQEKIGRSEQNLAIIASIAYLVMILLCIYAFGRSIDRLPTMSVINISIEIFAMFTGFVLFICCLIDVQKTGANLKYFMCMLNVSFLNLFTDAFSWILDGNVALRWLNIADNTLVFFCGPLSTFFFWMYLSSVIVLDKPFEKTIDKLVRYGLVIALALRILNIFTGIYFSVDEAGVYQRGPLFLVSMVYLMSVLLVAAFVILVERRQLKTYQLVAVMMYILAPFAAVLFTIAVYGLSINGAVVMVVLLLMYCVINISQGREKALADRDLAVASSIQENILPRTFPYLPEREEFDLYATMTPAWEVGGDFYDFFMIDDDHLGLVIADVSGKGMPAALFMMVARTIVKNQSQSASHGTPGEILANVNDQLCEGNEMELFVTAWLGILTLSTGRLTYASAGHEYPAIYRHGESFTIHKDRNSPPLGTMEGLFFRDKAIDLSKGDVVYLYTDGVTEATNSAGELFGLERMLEALDQAPDGKLEDIDKNVRDSIDRFVGEAPQFDDITMLTLRYGNQVTRGDH